MPPCGRTDPKEISVTETNAVWSLSGFGDEVDPDPAVQAAVLQALGASYIEVRSAWGTNVSELEPEKVERLKAILDEKGLKVSAVASPIGKIGVSVPVEHELARLRQIISVAQGLDTKYIRIFSFYRAEGQSHEDIRDSVMERLTALTNEAAASGVVLLHENKKGIYGDTPERVLDIMETVDSPSLRVPGTAPSKHPRTGRILRTRRLRRCGARVRGTRIQERCCPRLRACRFKGKHLSREKNA